MNNKAQAWKHIKSYPSHRQYPVGYQRTVEDLRNEIQCDHRNLLTNEIKQLSRDDCGELLESESDRFVKLIFAACRTIDPDEIERITRSIDDFEGAAGDGLRLCSTGVNDGLRLMQHRDVNKDLIF